jgi:Predicted membrane protein
MNIHLVHEAPSLLAAFLASLVECVEALTVVLAVGSVRGWSGALSGSATALAVLLAIIVTLGTALTRIPLHVIQLVVGAMLLLFGLRWLRKAVLRSTGHIPLHNEQAAFSKSTATMHTLGGVRSWNRVAFAAAFQITMLEGTEVVFIVVAIGAGGTGLLLPASVGALAALLVIVALGFAIHRPLASVPLNTLKFIVGVLLSAFGTFWVGEGIGLVWPGADWSIPGLIAAYLAIALLTVSLCGGRELITTQKGEPKCSGSEQSSVKS